MTGNPVGLVEFLLARYDEQQKRTGDCRIARVTFAKPDGSVRYTTVADDRHDEYWMANNVMLPISQALVDVFYDSRTVLADIAAKRRIIELHGPARTGFGGGPVDPEFCDSCGDYGEGTARRFPCPTLLALAAPFSSHPDWQPEWSTE